MPAVTSIPSKTIHLAAMQRKVIQSMMREKEGETETEAKRIRVLWGVVDPEPLSSTLNLTDYLSILILLKFCSCSVEERISQKLL